MPPDTLRWNQREVYIHAVGLGKYDLAALKFVYGRTFEQIKIAGDAEYGELVRQGEDDDEYTGANKINPLRDAKYPDYVRTNEQYLDANGKLKTVKIPTQVYTYYDNSGKKVERLAPKVGVTLFAKTKIDEDFNYRYDYDCDDSQPECTKNTTYLVNDGRHYEYLFITDEKSSDDPRANTFDAGFMASDVIRSMVDMDNAYYFLRFFRRGNPKFREFRGRTSMKMIYDTLFSKYKYIHFMLDFNFYVYGKWAPYVLAITSNGCNSTFEVPGDSTDYSEKKTIKNYVCEEYQRALKGEEYWIDENSGELRTLTPMSPADYVIAGMEGINYFYFNVLYRPAVTAYAPVEVDSTNDPDIYDKLEGHFEPDVDKYGNPIQKWVGQQNYFQSTENYIEGYVDYLQSMGGTVINVTPVLGRFQKDRWDIQDNENIYYDKVLRRGYAEEKMVAIYAIANAGWFDAKYRRESRANAVDQMFEGLENVKFTMLSDVIDEEALFTFSPYCYSSKDNDIVKVDIPINILTNWAINPPSAQTDLAYTPKKNLCAQVNGDYVPVHAGWTYFDKMWPMYWTMGNVANTSADTSVLQRFVSYRINAYDIKNYPEPDVNEVQFLNKDGNAYYRAVLAKSALDIQDQFGLTRWKDCKIADGNDDDCMKLVSFTSDGADAANAELGVMWLYEEKCVLSNDEDTESDLCIEEIEPEDAKANKNNGVKWVTKKTDCVLSDDNTTLSDKCLSEGDERFVAGDVAPKEQFRQYLSDKYSRLSPSFRLVQSASKLKDSEEADIAEGAEGWSRLVIMETTIDQLNSYAADNLGFAVEYASRY